MVRQALENVHADTTQCSLIDDWSHSRQNDHFWPHYGHM